MKEDKFIKQNAEKWKKLESTLNKLRSKSIYTFEKDELDDFINLYNMACGHLSFCRTYYQNSQTTSYLNRLVSDAHSYIYTTKPSNLRMLKDFLLVEFPLLIKANLIYILISTFIFMLASAVSFIYTSISVENAIAFLPADEVEAVMESDVFGARGSWDNSIMSSFILTNNIRVGILSFALGVTLGVGTSWVLLSNGYMLGGLAALYYHKGANLLFWSLILPHGVIELIAIFICGGAGIIVGYSIINPGSYTRKDSFIIRGKTALKLVLGTIPMFIVAGLIEGNITPSDKISEAGKLAFALFTFLLFAFYVIYPNLKYRLKDKIL